MPSSSEALHRLVTPDGAVEAVISSRAAALLSLRVRGVDLVDPTPARAADRGVAGAILAPWPNRVEGGRWTLDDQEQQLAITEAALGHATHGLLRERDYDVIEQPGELTMRTELADEAGYPFRIRTEVTYALTDTGITVTHRIRNESTRPAPVALGAHPYLRAGPTPTQALTLTVAADRALVLDEGHIPRGEFDVAGTAWDLRAGRRVASAVPHASYGSLTAEAGRFVHRLRADDSTTTELWAHSDFAWVQIYIASGFGEDGRSTAIAVEPMTAPPNAFRTGQGLRWLAPGELWELDWGVQRA